MDPETLVTFLFRAPPEARTVELLGSWDNFAHPYRMHPDKRRGQGAWSGCFKFLDIIFDGDQPTFHKPRTGGLKQGGTYWYYYRLDDEVEAYDDSRQTTADCPLMPGQSMNVIDVPMELTEPIARSRSASVDAVERLANLPGTHTLDPGAKFAALAPPPLSRVHARCVSEIALVATVDSKADSSHSSEVVRPRERNPHFSSDPPHVGVCEQPSRYYSNNDVAEDNDRSSSYSRQSWSSVACSSAHSFILDAYEVDQSPFADEEDQCFPFVDAPPMPSRAPPAIPASVPEVLDIPADDDRDVEAGPSMVPSPPMPNRPPPAIPVEVLDPITDDAQDSTAASTHPPTTPPHNSLAQQPTAEPRPGLRLDMDRLNNSHSTSQADAITSPSSKSPTDVRTPELDRLRRLSSEQNQPTSDEEEEYDDDDILSPTFSAATVSSRGGLNTPFRISIGQLCHASGFSTSDDSMEKLTERLRSLGHDSSDVVSSSFTTAGAFPPPIAEVDEATLSTYPPFPTFSAFADMKKESTKFDFTADRCTSPQPSLADAIFSELGHLRTAIA